MSDVKNGKITSCFLGIEDHGIFTMYIGIEGDCWGQSFSFGGWCLDTYDAVAKKRIGSIFGAEFIMRVLNTLEVNSINNLIGTPVRIDGDFTKINRIGHFLKDKWFDPKQLEEEITYAKTMQTEIKVSTE